LHSSTAQQTIIYLGKGAYRRRDVYGSADLTRHRHVWPAAPYIRYHGLVNKTVYDITRTPQTIRRPPSVGGGSLPWPSGVRIITATTRKKEEEKSRVCTYLHVSNTIHTHPTTAPPPSRSRQQTMIGVGR